MIILLLVLIGKVCIFDVRNKHFYLRIRIFNCISNLSEKYYIKIDTCGTALLALIFLTTGSVILSSFNHFSINLITQGLC